MCALLSVAHAPEAQQARHERQRSFRRGWGYCASLQAFPMDFHSAVTGVTRNAQPVAAQAGRGQPLFAFRPAVDAGRPPRLITGCCAPFSSAQLASPSSLLEQMPIFLAGPEQKLHAPIGRRLVGEQPFSAGDRTVNHQLNGPASVGGAHEEECRRLAFTHVTNERRPAQFVSSPGQGTGKYERCTRFFPLEGCAR